MTVRAVLLVVSMVVVSACVGGPVPREKAPRTNAESAADVRDADALGSDNVEPVFEVVNDDDAYRMRSIMAVGPDGAAFVHESVRELENPPEGRRLLREGGQWRALSVPPHPNRQSTTGVDISAEWVVWMETTRPGLDVQPWTLYAYHRKTRRVTELARSPLLAGEDPPPPPGFTGPRIAGDRVFWAQAALGGDELRSDIHGCRIDDCKPSVVFRDAAYPATTQDVVRAIRTPGGSSNVMNILGLDARTGRRLTPTEFELRQGLRPSGLAVTGHHFILTLGSEQSARAVVREFGSSRSWWFTTGEEGFFGYPVAGDDFVAWAESSGSGFHDVGGFVFDLRSETLATVGNLSGLYGLDAAGDFLFWQEQRGSRRHRATVDRIVRMR